MRKSRLPISRLDPAGGKDSSATGAHSATRPVPGKTIRFHDLRRTSATLLLAAGVHPKVVQERLGHSQIGITLDTYSHVVPTMQLEAASKLDAMMRLARKPAKSRRRA